MSNCTPIPCCKAMLELVLQKVIVKVDFVRMRKKNEWRGREVRLLPVASVSLLVCTGAGQGSCMRRTAVELKNRAHVEGSETNLTGFTDNNAHYRIAHWFIYGALYTLYVRLLRLKSFNEALVCRMHYGLCMWGFSEAVVIDTCVELNI